MGYLDFNGLKHLIQNKLLPLINGKSDIGHTHTKSQITDFPTIPSVTVSSGDSGKSYTIKVSTSAPASGTANNIITFVTG